MTGIQLKTILSQFKDYAPLYLADQSWDNVGLLVEPNDNNNSMIERIFLTNDLTEPVLDEAIKRQAQLIISYHPPIFSPLKRLTQSNWKERIILKCIKHGITVYSPHTSWDAVENGINQWLISAFGKGISSHDIEMIEFFFSQIKKIIHHVQLNKLKPMIHHRKVNNY
jgi:putative NIF3 family GTP cyclohydrolase 1 type 2